MKWLLALFLVASVTVSSSLSFAGPGDGGVPWPLGESVAHDVWMFEFRGDAHRIEIQRSHYADGQWNFDVKLTNLDRRNFVGQGFGVYDGNLYQFYIRDMMGQFYQFTSHGDGQEFTLEVMVFGPNTSEFKKVRALRTLTY
ncbi:hypothetical protein D3C87_259420 [compost metagenome]